MGSVINAMYSLREYVWPDLEDAPRALPAIAQEAMQPHQPAKPVALPHDRASGLQNLLCSSLKIVGEGENACSPLSNGF